MSPRDGKSCKVASLHMARYVAVSRAAVSRIFAPDVTAAIVRTLIAERYKVKLSHSSVCRLVHRLGLSAQPHSARCGGRINRYSDAVKQWLETDYQAIWRRAKREGAQIVSSDGCARSSTATRPGADAGGRRWSPAPARGSAPT